MNVRDVEVSEKIKPRVYSYCAMFGIRILGQHMRNSLQYLRLGFPPGRYAPFHREFGLWDVKLA